jgi:ABC-type uncharacterized transport system involved in gliding motility auxiliary subunit
MSGSSLALLAILFVATVVLVDVVFRGARVDLTDAELYTVSDGTRNILASIDEPINLYFYFSEQASAPLPSIKTYGARVREILEEFSERAAGKINLQVIDPLPFTEAEDEAAGYGLQGVPAGPGGDSIFFGLAGTNAVDGQEVIAFFDPSKESFLEYDLAKLVHNLANPKKPVIGLMSSLPISRGFDPATRQMREPWVITDQMEQLFDVRTLQTTATEIDPEVDVLMLVHPKELSEDTLYAIDQFVLGGGNALVFVDPHAELDLPPDSASNPQAAMFAPRASDLSRLFQAWGVAYDPTKVVLDARHGLQVSPGPGQQPVRHIGILAMTGESMNGDDVVLARLNSINLSETGFIAQAAGAETQFLPLLSSSDLSQPVAVDRIKFLPDPSTLLDGFVPTGERYVLAARVQGMVNSAFADGPPGLPAGATDSDESAPLNHLAVSANPVSLVVVADTDLLADRLWVRTQQFFGQRMLSPFANNGDFVVNALDNLTGSSDLISIRGRATSRRPFTRVEALQRAAEERFRATEQQLERELQETERKLTELQQGKVEGNAMILNAEQQQELQRFQQQRVDIRKQLRQVQRDLRQDIESLGTWMKFINIWMMPILLIMVSILVWQVRRLNKVV